VTVIDEQTSTRKLIQDVALARQKLVTSSYKLKAATATLESEMRKLAVRGTSITIAVLSGVLLERAVYRDRSAPGNLANAWVILREIVSVMLTGLFSSRHSNGTHDAAPPLSDV
jgi:hypothetical protein